MTHRKYTAAPHSSIPLNHLHSLISTHLFNYVWTFDSIDGIIIAHMHKKAMFYWDFYCADTDFLPGSPTPLQSHFNVTSKSTSKSLQLNFILLWSTVLFFPYPDKSNPIFRYPVIKIWLFMLSANINSQIICL